MSDNRNRCIVLLSGGLDSVVSLTCACGQSKVCLALTFDYHQRAVSREIEAAKECCRRLKIAHRVLRLDWLAEITKTALVDRAKDIPRVDEKDLEGNSQSSIEAMKAVWVPNRNGLFIQIAAAYAETLGAQMIITGFNLDEGRRFSDNSPAFVEAVNRSLALSTLETVRVVSYTQHLTKSEIVQLGMEMDAPLDVIYSCYAGEERMCGLCESCARLKRAFVSTGNWEIVRDRFRQ
jgi:7-cyano-7-deazaguanine synthase